MLADDDLATDIDAKYNPDKYTDIVDTPEPHRALSAPPLPQLFDLVNDPFERTDLAAAHPERVARMEAALGAWFDASRTRAPQHSRVRRCGTVYIRYISSAARSSSSRKFGWARSMIARARSRVDLPFRLALPNSVTK